MPSRGIVAAATRCRIGSYALGNLTPVKQIITLDSHLAGTVGRVEDLGSETRVYFGLGRHPSVGFSVTLAADTGLEVGARLELTWVEASLRLFDSATGEAIPM